MEHGGPMTDDIAAGSSASDALSPADGYRGDPAVRAEWDRRYADREQLWSGQPNGALVVEVAGLTARAGARCRLRRGRGLARRPRLGSDRARPRAASANGPNSTYRTNDHPTDPRSCRETQILPSVSLT